MTERGKPLHFVLVLKWFPSSSWMSGVSVLWVLLWKIKSAASLFSCTQEKLNMALVLARLVCPCFCGRWIRCIAAGRHLLKFTHLQLQWGFCFAVRSVLCGKKDQCHRNNVFCYFFFFFFLGTKIEKWEEVEIKKTRSGCGWKYWGTIVNFSGYYKRKCNKIWEPWCFKKVAMDVW